jgi:hypothetical protein
MSFEEGDDMGDADHLDRTLMALEGRGDDDMYAHITPPDSADYTQENDDTADIFMRIAREGSNHSSADVAEQNPVVSGYVS